MKKACVSSQSAPGVFPWPPEKQKTKKNSQETRGIVLDIIKHLKKIQHLTPPRPKEFCKYQTCADPYVFNPYKSVSKLTAEILTKNSGHTRGLSTFHHSLEVTKHSMLC